MHNRLKINLAAAFSAWKHRDQKRKYTGFPYFVHPEEVAHIVMSVSKDANMICAAYLHDTVEDTETTFEEIENLFGSEVKQLVWELTDASKPSDGNRATRKAIDREHIWKASREGQIIKLADLISNSRDIWKYDKDFAVVYLREKRLILEGLPKDLPLYDEAYKLAHGGLNDK